MFNISGRLQFYQRSIYLPIIKLTRFLQSTDVRIVSYSKAAKLRSKTYVLNN